MSGLAFIRAFITDLDDTEYEVSTWRVDLRVGGERGIHFTIPNFFFRCKYPLGMTMYIALYSLSTNACGSFW